MIFYYHLWLACVMAVVYWAKVYITYQKRRAEEDEKRLDLVLNAIFALLFTFAFLDLLATLPEIIEILNKIRTLTGG